MSPENKILKNSSDRKVGNLVENLRAGIPSVHFSIDDFNLGLRNAFSSDHPSLFEAQPFDFLKKIHDDYGVAVTCYLFYKNKYYNDNFDPGAYFDLSMVDGKFKDEFEQTSDWLKFGIHAWHRQRPMVAETREQTTETVDKIVEAIRGFAGERSLATTWRPHYFVGARDACDIMRDKGTDVVLTADDNRFIVVCLRPDRVRELASKGGYFWDDEDDEDHQATKLLFLHSAFRVEYKTIEEMKNIVKSDIEKYKISAFFTHEVELLS